MRIAYFVHGRGRGHASRASVIVPALRSDGHRVTVFGGGAARDLLGDLADFTPVDTVGPDRPITGISRTAGDLRRLREVKPDLVVSDGDAPCLIAATLLGADTLAIGHDLVFTCCQLPGDLPRPALRAERRSAVFATKLARRGVAVHFLPIRSRDARVVCASPRLRSGLDRPVTRGNHVVAYFRDRNGGDATRWAAARGREVHAFGDLGLDVPGVRAYPFTSDRSQFDAALRSCAAVISSAGSNLLGEVIQLGKPMLALYRRGDHEQQLNALLLERAGAGQAACIEDLTPRDVELFFGAVAAGRFRSVSLAGAMPDTVTAVRRLLA